ncbi:MAG: long-chain fatty acid--CoA ligase, partial [Flavobacteriales bacterium]
ESEFIEQILVTGESRHFPSALVVPSFRNLKDWCKTKNIDCSSPERVCENAEVQLLIMSEINRINERFGHWEQIKKVYLLPHEWAIDTGELTPNLKLKRKFIQEKFKKEIESLYAS